MPPLCYGMLVRGTSREEGGRGEDLVAGLVYHFFGDARGLDLDADLVGDALVLLQGFDERHVLREVALCAAEFPQQIVLQLQVTREQI